MRDEDDPFLRVVDFLAGKDKRAVEVGVKLEGFWDSIVSNFFMSSYLLFTAVILLLAASPFLLAADDAAARGVGAFMHVGAGLLRLCHQLPYRSFIFDGVPMPVCARDVGIHLGFIIGFATILLKQKPKILSSIKLPILCTIPIALDGITQTMLLLRESNNVIRLVTGAIFTFGVFAYAANRFIARWQPNFREQILNAKALAVDSAVVVALLYLLFSGAGEEIQVEYLSRDAAVEYALGDSDITQPAHVKAYYLASMAPLSVLEDPFYDGHRDLILDDVRESEWAKRRLRIFTGEELVIYSGENKTTVEYLIEIADVEHKFGVWAVAVLTEEPVKDGAPYFSGGSGEIHYYDALSGQKMMKAEH